MLSVIELPAEKITPGDYVSFNGKTGAFYNVLSLLPKKDSVILTLEFSMRLCYTYKNTDTLHVLRG